MKFRLRVLVAVAATAVLGMGGAVAAAVPASATINAEICGSGGCVPWTQLGAAYFTQTTGGINFIQNCSGNGQTTYPSNGGNPYCEIHTQAVAGDPVYCMEWDSKINLVIAANCDGTIKSQHWWWTGYRFRNLYATQQSDPPCINWNLDTTELSLAACSGTSTAWTW